MHHYIGTASKQTTAVLVALVTPLQPSPQAQEHLEELTLLAHTLGIKTVDTVTQRLEKPHVNTLIGKGKLAALSDFVREQQVDQVIFDDELTPSQTRNLGTALQCPVLDRNLLILNIFAMRAQPMQAKTQVELAQYQYLLPRLTKMWTHLSRQKGGMAGMRGPGEKELETDRRIVQGKIFLLRRKLQAIDRQSITQRKTRKNLVRVALVGYTNVGKSTLMNLLAKANGYTEDKLFATIGATVRRVVINNIPCLLTDTVGFIRKLPHTLIECFKSTLDEVREANVLLHVIDISHPACEEQIQVVQETLQEIGAAALPTILVFNKVDQLNTTSQENRTNLTKLQRSYFNQYGCCTVFISAKHQKNIAVLKELLCQQVQEKHQQIYPNYLKSAAY
ncbi:MAG: GTPase HflX [Bacteroidota bacterium]